MVAYLNMLKNYPKKKKSTLGRKNHCKPTHNNFKNSLDLETGWMPFSKGKHSKIVYNV